MRTLIKLGLASLLGALLLVVSVGKGSAAHIITAHADIAGAAGSGISGHALLVQIDDGILPTVKLIITVQGLAPNSKHGIHIHENGSCADTAVPFGGAGGHFDPGPFGNSTPPDTNHPFHMGDLPNLEANSSGRATLVHSTSRITLAAGPLSVLDTNGSAFIVHALEDLGTTGMPPGAGGGRIACGVIVPD